MLADAMRGEDPVEIRKTARRASFIADLAVDYLERHAVPKKRPKSVRDDRAMLDNIILPKLGAKMQSRLYEHAARVAGSRLSGGMVLRKRKGFCGAFPICRYCVSPPIAAPELRAYLRPRTLGERRWQRKSVRRSPLSSTVAP